MIEESATVSTCHSTPSIPKTLIMPAQLDTNHRSSALTFMRAMAGLNHN